MWKWHIIPKGHTRKQTWRLGTEKNKRINIIDKCKEESTCDEVVNVKKEKVDDERKCNPERTHEKANMRTWNGEEWEDGSSMLMWGGK